MTDRTLPDNDLGQTVEMPELSGDLFRVFTDISRDGFFITDARGSFLHANPSLCGMLGYSRKELLGMSLHDIDTSRAFEEAIIHITRMIEKDSDRYETGYRRKDGVVIDVEVNVVYRSLPETGGRFFGFVHHTGDRKKAERALKENQDILRTFLERSHDAVFLFEKGKCVDCNEKALVIMKCGDRGDIAGMTMPQMAPDRQADGVATTKRTKEIFNALATEGSGRFNWTARAMDGSEGFFEVSAMVVPCPGNRSILYTAWRQGEHPEKVHRALQESEDRFKTLSYASHEALLLLDDNGKIVYSNPAAAGIMGYGEREIRGMEIQRFLKPVFYHDEQKLQLGVAEAMPVSLQTGGGAGTEKALELTVARKDGSEAEIELSLISEAAGNRWHMIALFRDVTEQKRAIETLRKSEEKYRRLFEETKDAVFLSTPDGALLDINRAGVELFGYASKEEMLKINLTHDLYMNPEDRTGFASAIERYGSVRMHELPLKRRDGETVVVSVTANAVYDEVGNAVVYQGIMRDLTGIKKLEQQVRAFQRIDAMRDLTGGIAHNFNNILNIIIGNAQLAKMSADCTGEMPGYLSSIEDEVFRAADMVDQLLASGSRHPVDMKTVDVNRVVRDFEKVIGKIVSEKIKTVVSCTTAAVKAKIDTAQINQVLLNLIQNAREAMDNKGTLTIRVYREELKDAAGRFYMDAKPGTYVVISVGDTGRGIDEGLKGKIFEPFYTTDITGEKKGLGLSVVYGIIKQHGGLIDFESETGKGSVFRVYLPVAADRLQEERPVEKSVNKGKETILVAEDEDALREIAASILKALGYRVIATSDGEAALAVFEKDFRDIDMVLLDIAMPGMGGLETYREMKKIKGSVPVLFVTGYSLDGLQVQFIHEEGLSAIQKPYTLVTLGNKIREVLDKKK